MTELWRPFESEHAPVFAAPWEAHAFALVVALQQRGLFEWQEWTAALSEEIAGAKARGEPDHGTEYFQHWLAALESLTVVKGFASISEIINKKEEWHSAYLNTPHGKPVELK